MDIGRNETGKMAKGLVRGRRQQIDQLLLPIWLDSEDVDERQDALA